MEDIDELRPPTYAEHRDANAFRLFQQSLVGGIPFAIIAGGYLGLLAVTFGVHVGAAGKYQTI